MGGLILALSTTTTRFPRYLPSRVSFIQFGIVKGIVGGLREDVVVGGRGIVVANHS